MPEAAFRVSVSSRTSGPLCGPALVRWNWSSRVAQAATVLKVPTAPVVVLMRACTCTAVFGGVDTFQLGISCENGWLVLTQGEVQRDQAHVRPAELSVPSVLLMSTAPPATRVPSLAPAAKLASVLNERNACWLAVEEAASRARSGVTGSVRTAPVTTRRRKPTARTCGRSEEEGAAGT